MVLIGDTPHDVQAARRSGSRVIGVATGKIDAACLRAECADLVLDDLHDTVVLVEAVLAVGARMIA